jgi:hypothetical protein
MLVDMYFKLFSLLLSNFENLQTKAALPFELFENLNFRSLSNTWESTSQVEV